MDELFKFVFGSSDPLDVVLKKNESNPLVQKVKYAINAIAGYRGAKEIEIGGDKIEFPIIISDTFDKDTYAIALEFFPAFKSTGKMTVRIARRRWTYVAGFNEKAFPTALSDVSNYDELLDAFANGCIDRAKQKREAIVEDILKAFELLGASYIKIVDQSGYNGEANPGTPVSVDVNFNQNKETLREKNFGKNQINYEQASNYLTKLVSMPKVINLINSRINGNLLSETLNESITLGASISIIAAKAQFNMNRKLEIQVNFYDKTEL